MNRSCVTKLQIYRLSLFFSYVYFHLHIIKVIYNVFKRCLDNFVLVIAGWF